MQKKQVVKAKVVAQKWLWWSDDGKIFNNNNSGEFELAIQICLTCCYLNFLPLSDHHITSGLPPLISQLCFFCMGHTFFLQFGCFCVDKHISRGARMMDATPVISSTHHCDVVRKPSDFTIIMSYTMEHWHTATCPTDVLDHLRNPCTHN